VLIRTVPEPAHAQGGPCWSQPVDSREYAAWAGPWAKHGMSLTAYPQGCGVLSWRTYRWCPPGVHMPGCDWVENGQIQYGATLSFVLNTRDGAAASGRILLAAPPTAGDGIVLRRYEDALLGVEWDGNESILCRPWDWRTEFCGA
jgi:hypothetical protein